MKVLILYPNTPSARALGVKLMEIGHSVSVFCPDEVDFEIAGNLIQELEIIGAETDMLRGVINSFSVLRDCSFSDFKIILMSDKQIIFHLPPICIYFILYTNACHSLSTLIGLYAL